MNELALFAGAGGGLLASELLGWRTICAVEIDAHGASILAQRQNDRVCKSFPIWDDVKTFDCEPWKNRVDIISGGFPCQAFSTATHGESTATDLWPDMFRIVKDIKPPFVFGENVNLDRAIGRAAADCESIGYKTKILHLSGEGVVGQVSPRSRCWFLAYNDMCRQLLSTVNVQAPGVQELVPSVWEYGPENGRELIVLADKEESSQRSRKTRLVGETLARSDRPEVSSSPNSGGVGHGVADWVERHDRFGNGQIPAVAATAFLILAEFAKRSFEGG